MKRNTYRRRSMTRRRKNKRFSRRRATRGQQRGGVNGFKPAPYGLDTYVEAGEEEAPRLMTVEEIEAKRTEDDKDI